MWRPVENSHTAEPQTFRTGNTDLRDSSSGPLLSDARNRNQTAFPRSRADRLANQCEDAPLSFVLRDSRFELPVQNHKLSGESLMASNRCRSDTLF